MNADNKRKKLAEDCEDEIERQTYLSRSQGPMTLVKDRLPKSGLPECFSDAVLAVRLIDYLYR